MTLLNERGGESVSHPPLPLDDPDFFGLLSGCHLRFVGSPLVDPTTTARWLYEDAPFGLLAHDADPDPQFVYANRRAQRCFEYDWEEFTALRSRLSAEPDRREDRDRLLDAVQRNDLPPDTEGCASPSPVGGSGSRT